jgi:hypothetical protein
MKILDTFFGIIRNLLHLFYFNFKISSNFEYTTFSGEILLSHNTVNELCYVAQFVNRVVTQDKVMSHPTGIMTHINRPKEEKLTENSRESPASVTCLPVLMRPSLKNVPGSIWRSTI